jgi:hypothetical protein
MKKRKRTTTKQLQRPSQPGPKPDLLKVDGDWLAAVKKSLEKETASRGLAEVIRLTLLGKEIHIRSRADVPTTTPPAKRRH